MFKDKYGLKQKINNKIKSPVTKAIPLYKRNDDKLFRRCSWVFSSIKDIPKYLKAGWQLRHKDLKYLN